MMIVRSNVAGVPAARGIALGCQKNGSRFRDQTG